MAGKTIQTNLELRIEGWKAAVRSPRTPIDLKRGLRKLIRERSRQLKKWR
jgi:hypothetical protein